MSDATIVPAPLVAPEAPMEDEGDFAAPDLVECDKCTLYHKQLETAGEQVAELSTNLAEVNGKLTDAEEEIRSLKNNIVSQVRLQQIQEGWDHNFFTNRQHELNKLRAAVDHLMNLGVPIKDLLAPENVELLLQVEPAAEPRPFINPLARTPPGTGRGCAH
jgi:hypothetical protein